MASEYMQLCGKNVARPGTHAYAVWLGALPLSDCEKQEQAWKAAHPGCLWDSALQRYVNPATSIPYKTQP